MNGASPSRPDAYSMLKLGFATASQVTSASAAGTIRSANASSTGDIYRIEESGATGGKQYFLVENRQKTGTDAGLPGSGLLIWHVDESMSNNNNEAHYMVDLEEAHGGTQNLAVKTNYGDAGDTFPGTGAKKTFSDLTDPNSKYYDGTGDVMVSNISASSTSMSALMVRRPREPRRHAAGHHERRGRHLRHRGDDLADRHGLGLRRRLDQLDA